MSNGDEQVELLECAFLFLAGLKIEFHSDGYHRLQNRRTPVVLDHLNRDQCLRKLMGVVEDLSKHPFAQRGADATLRICAVHGL